MNKFLKNNLISGFDSVSLYNSKSFKEQVNQYLILAEMRAKESGITIEQAINKNFKERLVGQLAFVFLVLSMTTIFLMVKNGFTEIISVIVWITFISIIVLLKLKIKNNFYSD